jgi:hypothetical protein
MKYETATKDLTSISEYIQHYGGINHNGHVEMSWEALAIMMHRFHIDRVNSDWHDADILKPDDGRICKDQNGNILQYSSVSSTWDVLHKNVIKKPITNKVKLWSYITPYPYNNY